MVQAPLERAYSLLSELQRGEGMEEIGRKRDKFWQRGKGSSLYSFYLLLSHVSFSSMVINRTGPKFNYSTVYWCWTQIQASFYSRLDALISTSEKTKRTDPACKKRNKKKSDRKSTGRLIGWTLRKKCSYEIAPSKIEYNY